MAVSIIEQIISSTNANRPGGNYTKSYITIHETGNKDAGAGAKNHANWLSNGANGEIGYHYTVDDHEIYHHIPDNEKAWHAGDGGLGTGNLHSIGIELCVNADGDFEQTKKNAAWLVAKLMKDNSIPIGNVVQHNHWSGKNCPQTIRETGTWDAFLAMCQAEYDGGQPSPAPAPSGDTYTVQAGDCLSVIGAKLGLDWRDIAAVNGITEPYTIYAGQVLQLSGGQPAPAPAPDPAPQPSTGYKLGDHVVFSTCYKSSTAPIEEHLTAAHMLRNHGVITRIVEGAHNPYLLDNGLCWVNDGDIRGYYQG